jgi:hypothetical protein
MYDHAGIKKEANIKVFNNGVYAFKESLYVVLFRILNTGIYRILNSSTIKAIIESIVKIIRTYNFDLLLIIRTFDISVFLYIKTPTIKKTIDKQITKFV